MVQTKNTTKSITTQSIIKCDSCFRAKNICMSGMKKDFLKFFVELCFGFFPVSKNKLKHLLVLIKHWNNYTCDTEISQKSTQNELLLLTLVSMNSHLYRYYLDIWLNL